MQSQQRQPNYNLYKGKKPRGNSKSRSTSQNRSLDPTQIGSHLIQQARAFAELNQNVESHYQSLAQIRESESQYQSSDNLTPCISAKANSHFCKDFMPTQNSTSKKRARDMGSHLLRPHQESYQTPQRSVDADGMPGESPFIAKCFDANSIPSVLQKKHMSTGGTAKDRSDNKSGYVEPMRLENDYRIPTSFAKKSQDTSKQSSPKKQKSPSRSVKENTSFGADMCGVINLQIHNGAPESPAKLKPFQSELVDSPGCPIQLVPIDRQSPEIKPQPVEMKKRTGASPQKLFTKSPDRSPEQRRMDFSSFCEDGDDKIAFAMYENLMNMHNYSSQKSVSPSPAKKSPVKSLKQSPIKTL